MLADVVPDLSVTVIVAPVSVCVTEAEGENPGSPGSPFSTLAVVVPDASVIVIVAPVSVCSTEAETPEAEVAGFHSICVPSAFTDNTLFAFVLS